MLILIGTILVIAVAAVIIVLNYRYTRASEALFSARQEAARYKARLEAATRAAREFEERCGHLMGQLKTSMTTTGQALNVARQIEAIGQQMTQLLELAGYPDGAHALDQRAIDAVPHRHIDHTQPMRAIHPGQRRPA